MNERLSAAEHGREGPLQDEDEVDLNRERLLWPGRRRPLDERLMLVLIHKVSMILPKSFYPL